jgi:hypothetical protein
MFTTHYYNTWQLGLRAIDNESAIEIVIQHGLEEMADQGLFGTTPLPNGIGVSLAERSDGMFLWAALLLNYLECPALTPLERRRFLEEANLLEGLVPLYQKILWAIGRSHEKQRQLAANIMKWISGALYPISSKELHHALAITPGTPTSRLSLLSDYPRCIPQITCSLVAADPDGSIRFIHLSFKEFLESDPICDPFFSLRDSRSCNCWLATRCLSYLVYDLPSQPLQQDEDAATDGQLELQGTDSSQHGVQRNSQELLLGRHPFLKYASLCWVAHAINGAVTQGQARQQFIESVRHEYQRSDTEEHAPRFAHRRSLWIDTGLEDEEAEALQNISMRSRSQFATYGAAYSAHPDGYDGRTRTARFNSHQAAELTSRALDGHHLQLQDRIRRRLPPEPEGGIISWIPLLSNFLLNRNSVTAWVEACWTFNYPPNIIRLRELVAGLSSQTPGSNSQEREVKWIATGLLQLVFALKDLTENHYRTLSLCPSAIWGNDITSVTDPGFWPVWEFQKVRRPSRSPFRVAPISDGPKVGTCLPGEVTV